MSDVWRWSAVKVAEAIAGGELSSREATISVLDRIAAVNGKVNAVVEVLRETALEAADRADSLLSSGIQLGPLHGVPVTTKINVDQKGCATTNGIVANKNHIANESSPVVANWMQAGAVVVGRTNTPSFSWRWFTDNDLHGRTLNPWDPAITPGGSSGGAAAAVATGLGFLGHANDLGGSIRYPAYCCGVAGIRPTIGRVPAYNPAATADRPFTAQLMGVQGLVARTIADVRLGLAPMAVRDPRDPLWTPAPWTFDAAPRDKRVALYCPTNAKCDPEVAASLQDAGAALTAAGYDVEEVAPPSFEEAARLWQTIVVGEVRLSMFPDIRKLGDKGIQRSAELIDQLTPPVDLQTFSKALVRRNAILRDWIGFMEKYPIVLMPASLWKPFDQDLDLGTVETMGEILEAQSPLLGLVTLGLPVVSVPTGIRGGRPSGVQVVAGRFREDLCLAAGEAIERAFQSPLPIEPQGGR